MKRYKCSPWIRESLAELVGTMILLMFGTGSVAQAVLSRRVNGDMFSINFGWGIGVVMGVMAAGSISGAHLNPAVSLSLAVVGKFPWKKIPHYFISQYVGAFIGAGITLLTYRESIVNFSDNLEVLGVNGTAGIFVTFPKDGVSNFGGALDQIVGTAILLLCICAIGYEKNGAVSKTMGPFLVGLVVIGIGACFGDNAGYAINPARDLSPRILLSMTGWGAEVFIAANYWFWIPVVFCHIGGILGTLIFYLSVEILESKEDEYNVQMEEKVNLSI